MRNWKSNINEGIHLLESGEYKNAKQKFSQALKLAQCDYELAMTYKFLGECIDSIDVYEKAIYFYEKVNSKCEDYAYCVYSAGELYQDKNDTGPFNSKF